MLLTTSANREFLRWLRVTDLSAIDTRNAKKLIAEAVREIESQASLFEDEPIWQRLKELERFLGTGNLKEEFLRAFLFDFQDDFGIDTNRHDFVSEFREKMYAYADNLTEEQWVKELYLELEEGIEAYLDGDGDILLEILERSELQLQSAWESYSTKKILEDEITAESVVGHQMLEEGVAEWFQALSFVYQEMEKVSDDPESFEEGLCLAESGSRLLVAVQDVKAVLGP